MTKEREIRFVTPDDVETMVLPWGRLQWLSEPRVTGSQVLTTGIVTLAAGMGHERHNHPGCEEIIYFMEGVGEQSVELEDGRVLTRTVLPGELIHVPADLYHSTRNTGDGPMRFLVCYQYAGPEALLRSLPECEIEPAKND